MSTIVLFIVFFVTSLTQNLGASFISFDASSGTYCSVVKDTISDVYGLDDHGIWDTNQYYNIYDSMIQIEFSGYTESQKTYENNMKSIYEHMQNLTDKYKYMPTAMTITDLVVRRDAVIASTVYFETIASPYQILKSTSQSIGLYKDYEFYDSGNLTLSDDQDYIYLDMPQKFVNIIFGDTSSDDNSGTVNVEANKYSMFVASAVNMGILSVGDLTSLKSRISSASRKLVDVDSSGQSQSFYEESSTNRKIDFLSEDEERLLQSHMKNRKKKSELAKMQKKKASGMLNQDIPRKFKLDDDEFDFNFHQQYPSRKLSSVSDLETLTLRKFLTDMDPISCSESLEKCWLFVHTTQSTTAGAYFYPYIQHINDKCNNCSSSLEECKYLYLNFSMWFNEYREASTDNGYSFQMSFYGETEYLNTNYYGMFSTHCNDKIFKILKNHSNSNCSDPSTLGNYRFCNSPPSKLQELYKKCGYKFYETLIMSFSTAYGSMSTLVGILTIIFVSYLSSKYAQQIREHQLEEDTTRVKNAINLYEKTKS